MARPKKYNIKGEDVEKLASYGCTNTEIADYFGCSKDLITKSYSTNVTKGKAGGKIRLRQLLMKSAKNGNVTAQIWLSKQYLGMSDKQEVVSTELPSGFTTERI
tara:strand:+ start:1025 stop:1336 length:312 start_codon:yes stop_codon:yes gene_type:complete